VRSFKETITWRKAWPHFLVFILVAVVYFQLYFLWMRKYPGSDQPPEEVLLTPVSYIPAMLRNVQMLLYYILARKALNSYQKSIQHLYSETSRISLTWVRWLLNGFLLLIITVFMLFFLVFKYPENFGLFILINTAIITPYIYLVTIKGIGQSTLWQAQSDKNKEKIENEIAEVEKLDARNKEERKDQPAPKGLAEDKMSEILSGIRALMDKDKLYQEPELTLQALSDKLGIQSYQASQVINDGLKKNFYDLVNGYRVEEAKRLLLDQKTRNFTILSVGFEAGFNSKTTFNTVFKKFTGQTPTEFKAKQNNLPTTAQRS
jgi:AraC-like DNA-binding protein